jgi:hypothetical protein
MTVDGQIKCIFIMFVWFEVQRNLADTLPSSVLSYNLTLTDDEVSGILLLSNP